MIALPHLILTLSVLLLLPPYVNGDSLPDPDRMPSDPNERLAHYMEAIDDTRWIVRESATMRLARDRMVDERAIVQQLSDVVMTQEQRLRLLRAIEMRLLILPKGAIGISMKEHISDFVDQEGKPIRGVEIIDLIPGMPAEEVLRVGDVMVALDGEAFENPTQVSQLIKRHWPGDEVELEIARDGHMEENDRIRKSERLTVRIKLGSTKQLEVYNRNSRFVNRNRMEENRFYDYYQRFGPNPRILNPPENENKPDQISNVPMGFDANLIINQLKLDRQSVLEEREDSMTPDEFIQKWSRYSQDILIILQQNSFTDQDRLMLESLNSSIIELMSLEP